MPAQYAVIGYPLGYSLSPLMHNAFFKKEGIDAEYTSVSLTTEELEPWVKARKFDGYNVTVPYKESIIPFLDELTNSARDIGAVNTVKNVDGKLVGTNTDAPGFTMMLKEELNLSVEGLRVLMLGAGGAGRAILSSTGYAIGKADADRIYVYDTDHNKCTMLKATFPRHPIKVISTPTLLNLMLSDANLVINATPVGVGALVDQSILSKEDLALLKATTPVVDINYVPAETKLLRLARERGLPTCNGLGMLAGQGMLAEQFWFGKSLSYTEAKTILLKAL